MKKTTPIAAGLMLAAALPLVSADCSYVMNGWTCTVIGVDPCDGAADREVVTISYSQHVTDSTTACQLAVAEAKARGLVGEINPNTGFHGDPVCQNCFIGANPSAGVSKGKPPGGGGGPSCLVGATGAGGGFGVGGSFGVGPTTTVTGAGGSFGVAATTVGAGGA